LEWDNEMSRARQKRDWEGMFRLALDGRRAREFHLSDPTKSSDVCTMCGDLCSMKQAENLPDNKSNGTFQEPTL
jgi:phosphomethylpyrimidine synthase